jgi:Cys-tRNA(Pro)/Cys-tRNA(Cys) deacylase
VTSAGGKGAATPAIAALARSGRDHRVHRYEHDSAVPAYGQAAADALGVVPARVFKTLVASAGDRLVVAVVPVTAELDLKALAAAVGAKHAEMAAPAAAERATGYVVGGISPIGQKRRLPTVVDASAAEWPTMFVSGGRRGIELELSVADLLDVTGGRLGAIARHR